MDNTKNRRNDFKVLQAIYFLPLATRNEIARFTGRSPVSVTEILGRLLERGLVERAGKARSGSGRPSVTYRLAERAGGTVGVSLGASSFRLVALDAQHRVTREADGNLHLSDDPASHPEEILEQVSDALRLFIGAREQKRSRVRAVGIAPPGMVDTERGIWLHGLRVSGITHVSLGSALGATLGLPVLVEDAARCLAHVAAAGRAAQDARDFVYLYLGDGVGAGIMIGGEPYHGSHGMAGEVGHLMVEEEGVRCSCGNIGCLETVVSSAGILQRFRKRLAEGVISILQKHHDDGLTLEVIRDAAVAGDRLSQSTLFEIGTLLGDAVSKIIKLYNPRTLVIGGPVAVLADHLREAMWIAVRQRVIPEMIVDLSVEIAASHSRDEAIGAAWLAERRFWSDDTPAILPDD